MIENIPSIETNMSPEGCVLVLKDITNKEDEEKAKERVKVPLAEKVCTCIYIQVRC